MPIEEQIRLDGYTDVINSIADSKKLDAKSLFAFPTIPDEILRNQYKKNKMFAKVLDIWVEQALKHELKVTDKFKPVYEYIQSKDLEKGLEKALKINNLFGSSLIVLLFKKDKPEKLQDPIKVKDTYRDLGDIVAYRVYEKSQIIDKQFNSLGEVETFMVSTNTGVMGYHSSRCIWFNGDYKTELDLIDNNYFGYSMMTPSLFEAVDNYTNVNNMLPELLADSNISVTKIQDLNRRLASKNDAEQKAIIERVRLQMLARNFLGTMLLDNNDTFERINTSNFSGVDKLVSLVISRLVAESNVPHTFLLGEAPESSIGGQSGTAQERVFYDAVKSYRKMFLTPAYNKLFEICAAIKNISMKRVKSSIYEFKELYQPTELEKAQEEKLDAEEDKLQAETLKTTLENIRVMNELGLNYIVDEEGEVELLPSVAVVNNKAIIDTAKYEVMK